jgi:hypothetical protein
MADFSNIDVEKLVVACEEEDLWNISGENYHQNDAKHSFYSYLDLPFSALLVRHAVIQNTSSFYPMSCPAVPLNFPPFFFNNFIAK